MGTHTLQELASCASDVVVLSTRRPRPTREAVFCRILHSTLYFSSLLTHTHREFGNVECVRCVPGC